MTDIAGGAVEKAKKFTDEKPYSGKVTSTLVYGVQWDATMQFMDNNYLSGECLEDSYVRNSANKGWYSNNSTGNPKHRTGVDVDVAKSNCVKNIYDMAGNVDEWTMESYNASDRVTRGGIYYNDGADSPASRRELYGTPATTAPSIGFRLALYL